MLLPMLILQSVVGLFAALRSTLWRITGGVGKISQQKQHDRISLLTFEELRLSSMCFYCMETSPKLWHCKIDKDCHLLFLKTFLDNIVWGFVFLFFFFLPFFSKWQNASS